MSSQPPRKTVLNQITQVLQGKANVLPPALKRNARVPEILVQDADAPQPDKYPLLAACRRNTLKSH
jgi:penicillin-binding protein 1A